MNRMIFGLMTLTVLSGCAQQDINTVARGAGTILVRAVAQAEIDDTLGRNDASLRNLTAEQQQYCESRGNCLALPAANPSMAMQQMRDNRSFYEQYTRTLEPTAKPAAALQSAPAEPLQSIMIQAPITLPASMALPDLATHRESEALNN